MGERPDDVRRVWNDQRVLAQLFDTNDGPIDIGRANRVEVFDQELRCVDDLAWSGTIHDRKVDRSTEQPFVQKGAKAFNDAKSDTGELLPETAEKRVCEAPGHGRWNAQCGRAGNASTRPLTAHLATQILHVGENSLAS